MASYFSMFFMYYFLFFNCLCRFSFALLFVFFFIVCVCCFRFFACHFVVSRFFALVFSLFALAPFGGGPGVGRGPLTTTFWCPAGAGLAVAPGSRLAKTACF